MISKLLSFFSLSFFAAACLVAADERSVGAIEGRVYNVSSKEYLERARVTVDGTTLETFTDASGLYRFSQVSTGAAHVKVFFTGVESAEDTVNVNAGLTTVHDFNVRSVGSDTTLKMSEFVVNESREMDGAAIAINEKRFASNIKNVVTAGEFGISADGSVGEFVKYLPGISIDYNGGTANTISIEGAPANNVPVTVGGFDLASTSSASTSRSVELLQISIQNMARLEVIQSPTPESPGAALSGSINLVPRSAFERSRPVFVGSVYLMMRDNERVLHKTPGPRGQTYKVQPGFDFSYIVPVNKRFGFTVSGSYSKQFLPQDTVQTSWRPVAGGTNGGSLPSTTYDRPYLTTYLLGDALKFNNRKSFGLSADYRVSQRDVLSFSYQYGQFASEYDFNQVTWNITAVQAFDFSPTSKFTRGAGTITNTNAARWRSGETHMPSLVYRHDGPIWDIEAGAGYSHSTNRLRDTTRGYMGGLTAQRTGVTILFDQMDSLRPEVIAATNTADGTAVDYNQLSSYTFVSAASPNPRDSIDVKKSVFGNLSRDLTVARIPLRLKAGLDLRESTRDMRGSSVTYNYVGPTGKGGTADILLNRDLLARSEPFGFGHIQWMDPVAAMNLYQAHPNYFTTDDNASYRNAVSFSKRVQEVISAGYFRMDASFFRRRLKLIAGVRAEQTNIKAQGPLNDPTLNYQRGADGKVLKDANGKPLLIVPTSDKLGVSKLTYIERGERANKEYLRWFPSINGSFAFSDNLIARASVYKSVGRPDYNQYAGGIILPDTEAPTMSPIQVANVAIKAWSARTERVRLEYYFGKVGEMSIGAFRRDVQNFFATDQFNVTPEFLEHYNLDPAIWGNYQVITTRNLSTPVRMTGLELAYKQALTFLPHWARGVQVFANATALRTVGDVNANFSGYTPRVYNWGVSVTRPKFTVRANWNYLSHRRLLPITGTGVEPGTFDWRGSRLNLDLQGEYNFYKRFAVFANLRNALDATEDELMYGPSTPEIARFRRREDYHSSWTFGIKGTF